MQTCKTKMDELNEIERALILAYRDQSKRQLIIDILYGNATTCQAASDTPS